MSRMQEQAARVRACNYIKFEPRRNLPPCAHCVHVRIDIIHYAMLLSTHVTSYFQYGSIILPGLRASRVRACNSKIPPHFVKVDFYACEHETNQNSGMPGTKAKTSSGVWGPKMASGAILEHQIRVGAGP